MSKSFLHKRGNNRIIADSQREYGTGSNFFHDNRIRSCSYVKEAEGGYKAVPFYDKRDNKIYPTESTLRRSWTSTVHSNKEGEHAGGGMNKTLGVYNTQAQRNLMEIPSFKPPYPNSSHIEVGNRNKRDVKHYLTTYRNDMIHEAKQIQTNHPGIQAFRNKWLRSRLQKWSIHIHLHFIWIQF